MDEHTKPEEVARVAEIDRIRAQNAKLDSELAAERRKILARWRMRKNHSK